MTIVVCVCVCVGVGGLSVCYYHRVKDSVSHSAAPLLWISCISAKCYSSEEHFVDKSDVLVSDRPQLTLSGLSGW